MNKNHVWIACSLATVAAVGQITDSPDEAVAGIPVNYTEAKVGTYSLPDPLTLANGKRVTDAKTWREQRRPEILKMIQDNEYGRVPERPKDMTFDVFDKGTPTFDGKAIRKQLTIYFTKDKSKDFVDLLMYLPVDAKGPVPLLLEIGWNANNLSVSDPGVKIGRTWNAKDKTRTPATSGRALSRLNTMQMIERGYGVATFNYNDVDPDSVESLAYGIRAAYLKKGEAQTAPEEWGSISAWAWSISRMIDYFETDPQVDAKKIALHGVSRLGKTALWAGARDERIAVVIASVSGEGGAALSRRNYGETVAHLVEKTRFPYQFAPNYAKWADKMNGAPFDAHFVISLVAPRPLLLQTGFTDKWSDPYGEFLAAKAATPVYELLGKNGVHADKMPPLGTPLMSTLGYLVHDGGHGVVAADWPVFLDFLDQHLKNTRQK